MQKTINANVPFKLLTLSKGTVIIHDLNTNRNSIVKSPFASWKMNKKTKSKPAPITIPSKKGRFSFGLKSNIKSKTKNDSKKAMFNIAASELTEVKKKGKIYLTRIQGRSSFLENNFFRYKRDTDQQDKLILKRPSIFENFRDEVPIQSKKSSTTIKKKIAPNENIPKPYIQVQNTPSSLYKVPPSITSKTPNDWNNIPEKNPNRFNEVPVNKPSSFYEVPVNTPSSFYEVPPPYEYLDSTLDPATVIQMLQQEGSNVQSAQTSSSGSSSDQQNSVILSKPSAIALIDSGAVSSQSLPAVDSSFNSNTVSLSSSSSVNRVSTLDRNTALFAAFGLSLIPTLVVSLPFLLPSIRRGKRADKDMQSFENTKRYSRYNMLAEFIKR